MHDYVNLPRAICRHLIGKDHQAHHRMAAGATIMVTGIMIAQCGHLVEVVVFKATLDLIGYSFHGLGIVPFLEWLLDSDKDEPPPSGATVCEPAPHHRAMYDTVCAVP
jgi:hypothetical protein